MTEVWKDIAGYEGLYAVSHCGQVKSLRRTCVMRNGIIRTVPEKILTGGISTAGYKFALLYKNGRKNVPIHRIVATEFLQNQENKPAVNHKDGIRVNNHVDNLEWVTYRENIQHAIETGAKPSMKGSNNINYRGK